VLGAVLLVLGIAERIDEYWSSMGSALMVVGILQLVRFNRLAKNEEYRKKMEIATTDERNAYIRARHIYRRLEEIEASVRSSAEGCGSQAAELRECISDASRQLEALSAALCQALQDAGTQLETLEPAVTSRR